MSRMKSHRAKELERYLDDSAHPTGYRVTTLEMKSLGLRKNPNIIKYPLNKWYILPEDKIVEGKGDWGGIWVCRTLGKAKALSKYCLNRNKGGFKTRIFRAYYDQVLYKNDYRIKTNAIKLVEEIKK